jgi:hypothetical protein
VSITGFVFMLAFLAALGLALVRHPVYGVYAYVVVFYVHPPSRWWGVFLPDLRWSLLAAAVTLIATWLLPTDKGRPAWWSTTPARILIAYTVWLWIQHLWTLDPVAQREASILFTKYVVLFYLFYRIVNTSEEVRRFLLVHVAGCIYLGVLAFTSDVSGRLEGVGGPGIDEANALAMQLGTGVMIGAMIVLSERKWVQWACIVGMAFVLNGVVLSGSRGAFVALLIGGLAMLLLKPIAYKRMFYVFGVLGVVLFLALAPRQFWERMGTITAAVDNPTAVDNSAESRLVLIEAQWRMAQRYPLGAGHRGTEVLSTSYLDEKYLAKTPGLTLQQRQRSSHNTFMTALVEQGVPGVVLYLWLWVWCAKTLLQLRNHARKHWAVMTAAHVAGLGGALTVVFIAGMFVDFLKMEVQTWLFAVLASLSALMLREKQSAQPVRQAAVTAYPVSAQAHS